MDILITVHDAEEAIRISTAAELERVVCAASEEAETCKKLNIIFLEANNGNNLSFVVGGDDTVLSFTYGHRDPPYYASRGVEENIGETMTCYVGLIHHTEFPCKYVIPFDHGLTAVREFAESGGLPRSIEWIET